MRREGNGMNPHNGEPCIADQDDVKSESVPLLMSLSKTEDANLLPKINSQPSSGGLDAISPRSDFGTDLDDSSSSTPRQRERPPARSRETSSTSKSISMMSEELTIGLNNNSSPGEFKAVGVSGSTIVPFNRRSPLHMRPKITNAEVLEMVGNQQNYRRYLIEKLKSLNKEAHGRISNHEGFLRNLPRKNQRSVPLRLAPPSENPDSADETEESDVEESVKFDPKILLEQKKFRAQQRIEEQDLKELESARIWLIGNIKRSEEVALKLEDQLRDELVIEESDPEDDLEETCARIRAYQRKKIHKFFSLPSEVEYGEEDHILKSESMPFSMALGSYLHNFHPSNVLCPPNFKERSRSQRISQDKDKKKKNQYEDPVFLPPASSLCTNIELLTYKDIDTPSFRIIDSNDERSSDEKGSDDDAPGDADYVQMHLFCERKEKKRYYQASEKQSKKKKKLLKDPRLASPTLESYSARTEESYQIEGVGWNRRDFPIPGTKTKREKKRQPRKEWRSLTTEGNGLRLKLSIRKT